jgi:hypothetical protein
MEATKWLAGILACWAGACDGGSGYDIPSVPLSGKIGGQPWIVATAKTTSFLSSAEQFAVTMYADSFPACTGSPSGGNELLVDLPTQPSDTSLSPSMSATFYVADGNQSLVVTEGRVKVDAITAAAITGGLSIQLDGDNNVSGTFQVTICP